MDATQALTVGVAILGAGISGIALARLPRTPVRVPLYAFVFAGVLWAIGDLVATGATDATTKRAGLGILYTGAIAMPALWWIVALRWADGAGARLPLRSPAWRWAPLCWAGLMWLGMVTNPWHGAFMTPVIGGRNEYHVLWYVTVLPNYGLILAALAVEVAVARQVVRRSVQHQAGFLIAASSFTLLGNWLYVTGALNVNLTVPVLSVSVSLLLLGMAREGLFGVLPTAFGSIADDHPDGVVVVGAAGEIGYANPRARALLEPLQVHADRPVLEILQDSRLRPETDLPRGRDGEAAWWQALQGPTGVMFQVQAGSRRWLQVVAKPVRSTRGRDAGRLLILSDVTKRRQAEIHTLQNRRLDSVAALASAVSRDFQGAFAIVRANAELLEAEIARLQRTAPEEEGSERTERASRHLGRIFEASAVGADLAHQLQLHSGSLQSVRTTVDLDEIVDETCGLIESDLPPRTYLRHRRADSLLPVEVDPIHVRDCIFALLTNAMESMPADGGCIEVETGVVCLQPQQRLDLVWGYDQPAGDYAFVRVSDEGGGMDPATEERAFEPFFSTRQKDRGTGLSTVLGIVRAHEGAIALENDPGWGCTFTIYLRLAAQRTGRSD